MSSRSADAGVAVEAPGYGEVFDRGYRHYEGRREGRAHAVRALIVYSIRRGLGVKKRWTAKIIPIVLYAAAFLPVLIIIGVRALLGEAAQGFNYSTLYGALSAILLIFAAAAAPEMLCDDRREGVLPLYFSRAITKADYLLAKVGALGILMGSIALVPALVLFLGNVLLDDHPFGYLRDHVEDVGRIVAIGVLISLFYAAIGLVVAAFTNRKGIAAAIYIGFILVGSGIINSIFFTATGSWRRYLALIDPGAVPEAIIAWIFNTAPSGHPSLNEANLDGAWFLASVAIVVAVCGVVMYRRYLRED